MTPIAFRVEAGGPVGSGHLIRALALADELARVRPVRFIVSRDTAVAALAPVVMLDVVAGPLGDAVDEVRTAMTVLGGRGRLHVAPPELPALHPRCRRGQQAARGPAAVVVRGATSQSSDTTMPCTERASVAWCSSRDGVAALVPRDHAAAH